MQNRLPSLFILAFVLPTLHSCKDLLVFETEQTSYSQFVNRVPATLNETRELVVLTYNIQLGFEFQQDPWLDENIGGTPQHLNQLAEAIRSVDPDIILLQEVAKDYENSIIKNQAEYLANKLQMNYAEGFHLKTATFDNYLLRGEMLNVILTKYEISDAKNHLLLYTDTYRQTSCLEATLVLNSEHSIKVLNTHFKPNATPEEYQLQSEGLAQILANSQQTFLLGGDFNAVPGSDLLNAIPRIYQPICDLSPPDSCEMILQTGTSQNTGRFIDFIMVNPQKMEVTDIDLLDKQFWSLSDHLALYIQLLLD